MCAAERDLHSLQPAYSAFQDLAKQSENFDAPDLMFSGILDLQSDLPQPELKPVWEGLRAEIARLESENCTWIPAIAFDRSLREVESAIFNQLFAAHQVPAEERLPPQPERDGVAKRRRMAPQVSDGVGFIKVDRGNLHRNMPNYDGMQPVQFQSIPDAQHAIPQMIAHPAGATAGPSNAGIDSDAAMISP